MKKVAIITGASSGMGKVFALTICDNVSVDELWVIARNKDELNKLKEDINIDVKVISMDLSKEEEFITFKKILEKEKPNIRLLINASGYGKFEKFSKLSEEDNLGMIKLNSEGLTRLCYLCIPFMQKESKIINIASLAAYQPTPYMNVYAATKAYVLYFTRALNEELKKENIHVMAVCPYYTKTNFFKRAVTKNEVVKKYPVMYEAIDIVLKAWKDLKKNKGVSIYGSIARLQVFGCKILPHKLVMNIWLKQQKLK